MLQYLMQLIMKMWIDLGPRRRRVWRGLVAAARPLWRVSRPAPTVTRV